MSLHRLSQREIAELLGWSQSKVAKLRTGCCRITTADLEPLCRALELNPPDVLRDREAVTEPANICAALDAPSEVIADSKSVATVAKKSG